MTKVASDLLAENGGVIEAGQMFPDETEADVLSRLQRYLDEGYSFVVESGSEDDAAIAWAFYKAFTAVVVRIASRPATETVTGEVSRTYTSEQIRELRTQAANWRAEFELFVPDAPSETWGDVFFSARR